MEPADRDEWPLYLLFTGTASDHAAVATAFFFPPLFFPILARRWQRDQPDNDPHGIQNKLILNCPQCRPLCIFPGFDLSQTSFFFLLSLMLPPPGQVSHKLAFCPGPAESARCSSCQLRFESMTPHPCSLPQQLLTHMDFSFVDVLGSMSCFCPTKQRPLISISFHCYSSLRVSLCFPGHTQPYIFSPSLLFPLRMMHCTFSEGYLWKVLLIKQTPFFDSSVARTLEL